MKPKLWVVIALIVAETLLRVANGQVAQSTFDSDADGWVSVMLPYPHATPITILATNSPLWQPAGNLKLDDPDGSGQTGNVQYWQAPAKFLGNRSDVYGGRLSVDLRDQGSGFGAFSQEDVILVGGGLTLIYQFTNSPSANSFTHFTVTLTEAGWRRDSLAGASATQTDLRSTLSTLSNLFIRAEFQLGPDTEYIDNVRLCSGAQLFIQRAGTNVVLSWSQSACDAVLEFTDLLGGGASWTPEGSVPANVASKLTVTNSVSGAARYYRLRFQ